MMDEISESEEYFKKLYEEIEDYTERELANSVGFIISLRTYDGHSLSGTLNCIKNKAVYLTDIHGNKCYCSMEIISFYTVHPKKAKGKKK